MGTIYTFYCLICGNKFTVRRSDAKTCSRLCRVTLSQLQKHGSYDADDELTEDDEPIVEKRIEQVKNGGVVIEEEKSEEEGSGIPYFKRKKDEKKEK